MLFYGKRYEFRPESPGSIVIDDTYFGMVRILKNRFAGWKQPILTLTQGIKRGISIDSDRLMLRPDKRV